MKFQKRYSGSDIGSLLKLYVRDLYNAQFRAISYYDAQTGAIAQCTTDRLFFLK